MANKSKKKRSRAKRRGQPKHAVQEQTQSSLPESAGWGVFVALVVPMSIASWFVMRPILMAEKPFAQRCMVALALGIVLSALLTYTCNEVLYRLAHKRRLRR